MRTAEAFSTPFWTDTRKTKDDEVLIYARITMDPKNFVFVSREITSGALGF